MQLKGISAGLSRQTSSWQIYEISRWEIDQLESSPTILVHLIEGMYIIWSSLRKWNYDGFHVTLN